MIFLPRAQTLPNFCLPSLLPIIIIPCHLPCLIPSSPPHLILPPLISSKMKIGIKLLPKQTPYCLLQSVFFFGSSSIPIFIFRSKPLPVYCSQPYFAVVPPVFCHREW